MLKKNGKNWLILIRKKAFSQVLSVSYEHSLNNYQNIVEIHKPHFSKDVYFLWMLFVGIISVSFLTNKQNSTVGCNQQECGWRKDRIPPTCMAKFWEISSSNWTNRNNVKIHLGGIIWRCTRCHLVPFRTPGALLDKIGSSDLPSLKHNGLISFIWFSSVLLFIFPCYHNFLILLFLLVYKYCAYHLQWGSYKWNA